VGEVGERIPAPGARPRRRGQLDPEASGEQLGPLGVRQAVTQPPKEAAETLGAQTGVEHPTCTGQPLGRGVEPGGVGHAARTPACH
jgi:hypothetical protein